MERVAKKMKISKEKQYECICLTPNEQIPLKMNVNTFHCILTNYKKYLKSRNVWDRFSEEYRNQINRNIKYPIDTVQHLKINKCCKFDDAVVFMNSKNTLVLHLKTANFGSQLLQTIDYVCMEEFISFINKHVYNNDMEEILKLSTLQYNSIRMCNF